MIEGLDSPFIHTATDDNFLKLALENSDSGPVLLNFWSKKTGPCLRLYPILDKVIHHYKGGMLLVNIDVDTEFKVTKEYGIASVPTLKILRKQKIVDTLFGHQSENDLRNSLDKYVSSISDQALVQALTKYTEGQQSTTLELIATAIVADPDNMKLPTTMCKILIHEDRYKDAAKLLDSLPNMVKESKSIAKLQIIVQT